MNNEQSLIKVNGGLLAALSGGQINIQVFAREILVLKCIIAGTSFRQLDKVENKLTSSVALSLKREPQNEFDAFAIALWFEDTKVGYIPKNKNEVIARLMDAGKIFYATIEGSEVEGNWLKLEVKVMLKD